MSAPDAIIATARAVAELEEYLEDETAIVALCDLADDLVAIVTRLAEGERSDDGHTALREAAKAALEKARG